MSIDIIRFEYIAEYFRGEPTIAEKALHCLFMEPTTSDLVQLLPYYQVHIYVIGIYQDAATGNNYYRSIPRIS